MRRIDPKTVLNTITDFYLSSKDFNGITAGELFEAFGPDRNPILEALRQLISQNLAAIIDGRVEINPHIIRTHFEPTENQLERIDNDSLSQCCLYPRAAHLETVVDRSRYRDQPYKLALALGEPQLAFRAFDLSVLEIYRNDPRYFYRAGDISGSISVRDEHFESDRMVESDQVLLESFGFAYDENLNRAVAAYLRYLADLSPEHQQIWKARELPSGYKLHPDYYRNTIIGDWGERVSICDAILKEIWVLNQMSEAMDRPTLFRKDFGEYGEDKPRDFTFLLRPTLSEYNNFVHLLDKMLSENINRDFFQSEVSYQDEEELQDGRIRVQEKGTLRILDEWVRRFFRTDDWEPWDTSIKSLKKIRRERQRPAHAIDENRFDQKYFKDQRQIVSWMHLTLYEPSG